MSEGLRERKMRAARRAMEGAAVQLAYDEGVAAVTVDRVCSVAMVSRSTFFNYFPSLDEAIFGSSLDYDRDLTDRILAQNSHDLVMAAVLIVMESVRGQADDEITRQRFALFVREAGTTSSVSWASNTSRGRLIDVIAAWLDEHPEHARLTDAEHRTEARLTVGLSIALSDEAVRHVPEVNGEYPVDVAAFRAARQRLAAISQPAK